MLGKIRLRITLLITVLCFFIHIIMSLILLFSNYKQIYINAMSDFKDKVSQIYYDISENSNINLEKIRDYQNNYNIRIVIYENQKLTNISQKICSPSVIDFSRDILSKNYDAANKKMKTDHINYTEYDAKKISNYFYGILLLPGKSSETEIVIIATLKAENAFLKNQIKKMLIIMTVSLAIIFILSYILAGYILIPVRKSHEQQNRFIASASHEIRNPVNTIISALEAAEKGKAEEHSYFCNIAKKEGKRLSLLTEELLTLASSSNRSLNYKMSDCELDSIIIDCYDAFLAPARSKNISFRINIPSQKVAKVKADAERIKQVINILLNNAVSFTEVKGRIEISYYVNNEWHIIIVSDNGPGITDTEKEHIFEAFYRADHSRSNSSHFGLGLSIAKEIINYHNGKINVRDNKPHGTSFEILLPANH